MVKGFIWWHRINTRYANKNPLKTWKYFLQRLEIQQMLRFGTSQFLRILGKIASGKGRKLPATGHPLAIRSAAWSVVGARPEQLYLPARCHTDEIFHETKKILINNTFQPNEAGHDVTLQPSRTLLKGSKTRTGVLEYEFGLVTAKRGRNARLLKPAERQMPTVS